jgi:hypothetical protein
MHTCTNPHVSSQGIPISSVGKYDSCLVAQYGTEDTRSSGHALALAEETGPFDSPLSSHYKGTGGALSRQDSRYSLVSPASLVASSSRVGSNHRSVSSSIAGGTTKVLSDLQAGVEHGDYVTPRQRPRN